MKTTLLKIMMIALAMSFAACEKPQAENETPVPPPPSEDISGFGAIVNADGSVLIESDNGVDRINSIISAIDEYADKDNLAVQKIDSETGKIVETGDKVKCSNVFYLQRDGLYYIQGKGRITKAVKIMAEEGDGALPVISPISDATGAVVSDMITTEADVEFKNIHFYGIDPITNQLQERVLRVEAPDGHIVLENCFCEYCRNHFLRMEAPGVTAELRNSTFRNFALGCSPNGRLLDARKNDMKLALIENCSVYNITGQLIRQDGKIIDNITIRNTTFYNCGYPVQIYKPATVIIENNIFGNCAYLTSASAYLEDEEGNLILDSDGNRILDNDFWDLTDLAVKQPDGSITIDGDLSNVNISIRNNNVFTDATLAGYYEEWASKENSEVHGPVTELGDEEKYLQEQGCLRFENNIEEIINFENPAPLDYDNYITQIFNGETDGSPLVMTYYVTGAYSFDYNTGESLTAATDGGKLGVRNQFLLPTNK